MDFFLTGLCIGGLAKLHLLHYIFTLYFFQVRNNLGSLIISQIVFCSQLCIIMNDGSIITSQHMQGNDRWQAGGR